MLNSFCDYQMDQNPGDDSNPGEIIIIIVIMIMIMVVMIMILIIFRPLGPCSPCLCSQFLCHRWIRTEGFICRHHFHPVIFDGGELKILQKKPSKVLNIILKFKEIIVIIYFHQNGVTMGLARVGGMCTRQHNCVIGEYLTENNHDQ